MSCWLVLAGLLLLSPEAQSAAPQVPEKEKKGDRESTAKPGRPRVYTNEDLRVDAESQEPGAEATTPVEVPSTPEGAAGDPEQTSRDQEKAIWKQRFSDARSLLATAEGLVAQLQERVSGLGLEILLSTDTYRILALREQEHKTRSELEMAKREAAEARQRLADLEEDARRDRVPPGWILEP